MGNIECSVNSVVFENRLFLDSELNRHFYGEFNNNCKNGRVPFFYEETIVCVP